MQSKPGEVKQAVIDAIDGIEETNILILFCIYCIFCKFSSRLHTHRLRICLWE